MDALQVFGIPLSPFVRKVHVAAAEKGLAIEPAPVDPRAPSPEFLAASPFRKIPALRHGDYTLADSTAIVAYLEALQPEPALLPAEPRARGRAVWFEEFADTIMVAAGAKIVFNRFVGPKLLGLPGDEDAARKGDEELVPILAYLERSAPAAGWLAGEAYSLGDIAVASVLTTLGYVRTSPDAAQHPATAAWYARVVARPAWREVAAREQKVFARLAAAA